MAYFSAAILLVSVLFLAYRNMTTMLQYLPQWLQERRGSEAGRELDDEMSQSSRTDNDADAANMPEVDIRVEAPAENQKTPKAEPRKFQDTVPSFSLSQDSSTEIASLPNSSTSPKPSPDVPSFPAASSQQKVSSMPPPPKRPPSASQKPSTTLMPPPARHTPSLAPPPSAAASLRVPTTGSLPNRGPPANSQQRANGGLTPNGGVSTPNKRGKVLLSPGHSPMDWAALTNSKKNLSGVSTFQHVTPSVLKSMTGRKGKPAWSSWQGKVYNITPYVDFHPGGKAEIMKAAGRDGTALFMEVHPWVNWENMLGSCLVGIMVPESHGMGDGKDGSLEDID